MDCYQSAVDLLNSYHCPVLDRKSRHLHQLQIYLHCRSHRRRHDFQWNRYLDLCLVIVVLFLFLLINQTETAPSGCHLGLRRRQSELQKCEVRASFLDPIFDRSIRSRILQSILAIHEVNVA